MPPKTMPEPCCGNNFAKKNTSTIPAKDHVASTVRNKNLGGGGRSFLAVFQPKTMLSPYVGLHFRFAMARARPICVDDRSRNPFEGSKFLILIVVLAVKVFHV